MGQCPPFQAQVNMHASIIHIQIKNVLLFFIFMTQENNMHEQYIMSYLIVIIISSIYWSNKNL